jgi:hypothetical protein
LLRDVQRKHGQGKLKEFPVLPIWKDALIYNLLFRVTKVNLLDYFDYDKEKAKQTIEREIGWEYYGAKHYESRFTRFFQSYYLPVRFGFDKRKAHLSSLILSGQITREEALEELKQDLTTSHFVREETDYVLRKLGISPVEFDRLMSSPVKSYRDYRNNERGYRVLFALNEFKKRRRFGRGMAAAPASGTGIKPAIGKNG